MTFQEDKFQLSINDDSSTASERVSEVSVGSIVDNRYVILSLLGQGGMGIAYKAMDNQLKQQVVLKFLLAQSFANAKDISRFKREAKTASRLSHPGIVKVIDFAILADERPYLVMEFLDGETLAERIRRQGQLPTEETLDIFIQICDALAYAHAEGILHRDVKPSNIMVTIDDINPQAKLLDFGMAKFMVSEETTLQRITQTDELVGSILYMSPEQARNASLDARSDLYSLGCTIYETLTGGPPHLGPTSIATLLKRETDQPMALSEASFGKQFSDALEQLVSKLLKTNPGQRYQSAEDVKQELLKIKSEGFVEAKPAHQKPVSKNAQLLLKPTDFLVPAALTVLVSVFILARWGLGPIVPKSNTPSAKDVESVTSDVFNKEGMNVIENRYEPSDWNDVGNACLKENQPGQALIAYKKCIALCQSNPHFPKDKYALALTGLAYSYQLLGQYKESADAASEAIKLYEQLNGKNSHNFASIISHIGCSFLIQKTVDVHRAFQTAAPLLERALTIQRKLPDPEGLELPILLGEQGTACMTRGLLFEADWRLKQSAKLFRSAPGTAKDPYHLTRALVGLVNLYRHKGEYDRIPPLCHEMVVRFDELPANEKRTMADYLLGIANILRTYAFKTRYPLDALRQAQLASEATFPVYRMDPTLDPKALAKLCEQLAELYKTAAKAGDPKASEMATHWSNEALSIRHQTAKAK
jgi:serine/threonine protein kinase